MSTAPWTAADIPDLAERTIVVTGANSGIGLETAALLAVHGATVVLGCRNTGKAAAAKADIEGAGAPWPVEILRLDLADQAQIADAAAEAIERFGQIDRLVNNAGVMASRSPGPSTASRWSSAPTTSATSRSRGASSPRC